MHSDISWSRPLLRSSLTVQYLRRHEEILGCVRPCGCLDHQFKYLSLIIWIHSLLSKHYSIQHHYIYGSKPCTYSSILAYLVNLIDNSERRTGKLLQGHEIQNSRNTFLSTTLMKLCENMKTVLSSEFHFNLYSILFIVFLTLGQGKQHNNLIR